MKTLLAEIARLCFFHYRKALFIFAAILILLCLRIHAVTVETDFLKLFPQENTAIGVLSEIMQDFSPADNLYFLVEKKRGGAQNDFIDISERFASDLKNIRINGRKALVDVQYKFTTAENIDDAKTVLSALVQNPLHFLDDEDILYYEQKLSGDYIFNRMSINRKILLGQTSYIMKEIISIDPLETRSVFQRKLSSQAPGFVFDTRSGYFLSEDNNALLITATPAASVQDKLFSRNLVSAIEDLADKQQNASITFTGAHAIAAANESVIRKDMITSLAGAFVGVLVLFYLVYRRLMVLLFVSVPIVIGILFTLTIASFSTGINLLTSVFSAVVVGLGIDFSIHLYDRFHSERASGRDTLQALNISLEETGVSVLTGGITTVLGFLSLCFATTSGFNEFGFLVAAGIAGCLAATFFVLPALLVWQDRHKTAYSYRKLWSFGLPGLTTFIEKHFRMLFVLLLCGSSVSLYLTFKVPLDMSIENLKPKNVPAYTAQDRISQLFGSRGSEFYIVHEGKNLDTLLREGERVQDVLYDYAGEGRTLSMSSPGTVLNSTQKQAELLLKLTESVNFGQALYSFDAALEEHGFSKSYFEPTRKFLSTAISSPESLILPPQQMIETLRQTPLNRLIQAYIAEKDGTVKTLSHVFLDDTVSLPDGLLQELREAGDTVRVTGISIIADEVLSMARSDLVRCLVIAAFLVMLSLWVHFKKTVLVLFALVPLVMGFVWMMAAMALLKFNLNAINLVILPVVIGIGIDDGVHILQRYLKTRNMHGAITGCGRAVIVTSLATIISFGSLIGAAHNALAQMGVVVILGIGFCLFNSLFSLALLLIPYQKRTYG